MDNPLKKLPNLKARANIFEKNPLKTYRVSENS